MEVLKTIEVPTGKIMIVEGERGKLEMLSLADYGQHINLNQHQKVNNDNPLLPLSEKWVVTVSTQYGCSMGCKFCDVPKVGAGRNATYNDLCNQIATAFLLNEAPPTSKRLNVHFARMGEPTFNFSVLDCAFWLHTLTAYNPHPVVSTMMPKCSTLKKFITDWMQIKNDVYEGNAGLQLSINSTNEVERFEMFSGNCCTLEEIREIMSDITPRGRKITLNFAVADYTVDAVKLSALFSPDKYIVKLTPMHKTNNAVNNCIETRGDYTSPEPYLELEAKLQKAGFETLVFIASENEDDGLITCGNAILSGSVPRCKYTEA